MNISSDVLESAAADPVSPAWGTIWEQSCHQGSCDPASAALLPWLAETIATFSPVGCETAVALAGFIALDATDADRATYADEIAALRALAIDCLPYASDDGMFIYLHQAVLGFDGEEIWGKELDHLNDGEVDVQCPECDEEVLIDLLSEDSAIEAGLSSALGQRLHAAAVQAGRESVAAGLTQLFGRLSCPNCGTRFNLAEHLAGIPYP